MPHDLVFLTVYFVKKWEVSSNIFDTYCDQGNLKIYTRDMSLLLLSMLDYFLRIKGKTSCDYVVKTLK